MFSFGHGAFGTNRLLRRTAVGIVLIFAAACSGPTSNSVGGSTGGNSIVNDVSKFAVSAYGVAASPRLTSSANVRKGGGRYMVGSPYKIAGNWYHPSENTSYDQTGTASWYGPNFHGRLTANGEIFDQFHLSGAHPTLPLPSYVRVQNLSNGRSVIVRLNDRGPFAHNRLIDVSKRTAEVLDFINSGTTQVRVTYIGRAPVEGDDTRYLVASINSAGGAVQTSAPARTQRAPSIISRQNGGLFGAFANLFSYSGAEQGEQIISQAHAAANAVGQGPASLQNWRNTIEGVDFMVPVDLGTFANSDLTFEIARQFAVLGAVQTDHVGTQIQLSITSFKTGVTPSDVEDLRKALGI